MRLCGGGDAPSFLSIILRHALVIIFALLFYTDAFPSAWAKHHEHAPDAHDFGRQFGGFEHSKGRVFLRLMTPIAFGEFTLNNTGSVSVDSRSGTCSARGDAVLIRHTCSRGLFEMHGKPGEQVMLYLPAQAILTTSGANSQGILRDFKMDHDNPIIIGPDGKTTIGFGATLSGQRNMHAGKYAGEFQVEAVLIKQ